MDNKQVAKATKLAFDKLIRETSTKATHGSTKAALDLLGYMTAQNLALRALGYEVSDNNRLRKYRNRKLSETFILAQRCANGDSEAAKILLDRLTKG